MKQTNTLTRREFLKASAGVAVGGALASLPIELFAHAQGSDKLRVGLIGCGGRGTGAAIDIIDAHPMRGTLRDGRRLQRPTGRFAERAA